MTDFLNSLIALLGVPTAFSCVAGISAWFGSIWRDRLNGKIKVKNALEIEQLKATNTFNLEKLKDTHARETKNLEQQLQIERHATQIAHTHLFEKRALVIDESYKLLVELNNAIYETFRPDYFGRSRLPMQQAHDLALSKFDTFIEEFEKHRIYFTASTSKIISSFYAAAAQALDQSRVVISSGERWGIGDTPQLQKLFDAVEYKMQEARDAVESDFRELMHVYAKGPDATATRQK
ncbi:hypothetical protein QCD79_00255 [Pseudomonas quasicaspiana]|nr:hypothetical protein [Pseudomonas quasicaspiana]